MPASDGSVPLSPRYVRVANAIREDLVRGEFQPAQRMKTIDLATRYDTGLNTVREALQQLSGEGWVILEPNKGAVVRPLTRKVIGDIYDMREALEVHTARNFVDNASNNHIRILSEIQDRFESAAEAKDFLECSIQNGNFHNFINLQAGNEEIAKVIENYGRLMSSIRRYVGYDKGRAEQVTLDHRQLIEAFQARDAVAAARITSRHLRSSCEDILEHYATDVDRTAERFASISAIA